MQVAILGCGPTGLAAAQAVAVAGHKPVIYSRLTKSKLYGAQYLHEPIPGLDYPEPPRKVSYVLDGTVEAYREKVYGSAYQGQASPEEYEGEHEAWDIRWSYDRLWDLYFNDIKNIKRIEPHFVRNLVTEGGYGLVINTIPKNQLCESWKHEFTFQNIWAMGDAPGIQSIPHDGCPDDTVLCSGRGSDDWYRISNVYGYRTMEWSHIRRPSHNGRALPAAQVGKPLRNNCDCTKGVLHVGRYGKWEKGVVVHHAFNEVVAVLSSI